MSELDELEFVSIREHDARVSLRESLLRNGYVVFTIETGNRGGRERVFESVKATFPLDPPVVSARSWDALSDSLWGGIVGLGARRIAGIWVDADNFARLDPEAFEIACDVFRQLIRELRDIAPIESESIDFRMILVKS